MDFAADPRLVLREAMIDLRETDAFRLVHGASDGWPGWSVDRLGDFLLSQSENELTGAQRAHLETLAGAGGAYASRVWRRRPGAIHRSREWRAV
jgi:23S rRNA G2069 N7-methylase RlmK/C1962 C5-methylase RlmI